MIRAHLGKRTPAERHQAAADEQAAAARRKAAEAEERAMRAQQERAVAQEDEARAREVDPDTLDDEGEPRGDRVGTDQLRTDQREPNRAQASCAHEAGPVRGGLPRPSSAHTRVEVRRRKLRPRD